MKLSEIKIGQTVYSVFGSAVDKVAVVIGINADGSIRVAKDAFTCQNAENVTLPVGVSDPAQMTHELPGT